MVKEQTTPKYIPSEIESKWQEIWEKEKIYSPDLDSPRHGRPYYQLMMFPYPSAEGMHVGNMYAFTGSDIHGRFKRMQGYDVFEPFGLDGFGIHSENYAIKVGRHPKEQAERSQENFYKQVRASGHGFDWTRLLQTYDPSYYKWTQWFFIQLFKAGLAYRKKAPVNFCPSCKTVLADEQVIDGKCERCGTTVEKKALAQWFFKITDYADRLLEGLEKIDWPQKVKIAQREWIGKSEGLIISFPVKNQKDDITVFTKFPETIFGVTYMVLAPEHELVIQLSLNEYKDAVTKYVQNAKNKTEIERTSEGKQKTGVFTGSYCINPVNGKSVPIWVADYVLAGYGTGAVMGVPGSDKRDFAFAKTHGLPVIRVIGKSKEDTSVVEKEEDVLEEGILVNSAEFSGSQTPVPAKEKIKDYLEQKGFGKRTTQYHLRDWLISRQRYWGPPIPMIHCEKCDWNSVKDEDLPVSLPDVADWKPIGTGKAPLANHPEFYETTCPLCGGKATRETDVSDTFLDSAWYFLRYLATDRNDVPFPSVALEQMQAGPGGIAEVGTKISSGTVRKAHSAAQKFYSSPRSIERSRWLPADIYTGGAEHSVLHLLYARFMTMFLHDRGFLDFEEPFPWFFAHGLIINKGAKMSKSKGNVVIPDTYIKKYGADTLRTYLMFIGPFEMGGEFSDSGIEGIHRFLKRVWTLVTQYQASSIKYKGEIDNNLDRIMHKTIKQVTEDIERLRYNTAIARIMEYYNELYRFFAKYSILNTKYCKTLVLLLAPFAPYMTEELYQRFMIDDLRFKNEKDHKSFHSIHVQPWPSYDPKYLETDEVTVVVQVNGKMRDTLTVKSEKLKVKSEIEKMATKSQKINKYLQGKTVKQVIYVPGRVINFVTV